MNRTASQLMKPDYSGGSIVNLMSSLGQGLGGAAGDYAPTSLLPPAEVAAAETVVLLLIDGLGYDFTVARDELPTLNGALRGPLTSVFPSTTASAVTTYLTGDAPAQHAVTGWHMYVREVGAVMTVLPGQARFGGPALAASSIDLPALLGTRAFVERIDVDAAFVMPHFIADSAFTLEIRVPCLMLDTQTGPSDPRYISIGDIRFEKWTAP